MDGKIERQSLIYNDKILEDDQLLDEIGIDRTATLVTMFFAVVC